MNAKMITRTVNQTRIESLIEISINISTGFIVALLTWTYVVIPLWNIDVTMVDNLAITGLSTVVSIIRSYFWRRFFNAGLHKQVHKLIGSILHG